MGTGQTLRSLSSSDLYDVSYHLFMRWGLLTKEEHEVMAKNTGKIRSLTEEAETGIPAAAAMWPSADGEKYS